MIIYIRLQGLKGQSVVTFLDKCGGDHVDAFGPFENEVLISKKHWDKALKNPAEDSTWIWYFKDLQLSGILAPRAVMEITWFEQFEIMLMFEFFDISMVNSTADSLVAIGLELQAEVESEVVTIGIDRPTQHSVLFENGLVSSLVSEFVHWDELRLEIPSRF